MQITRREFTSKWARAAFVAVAIAATGMTACNAGNVFDAILSYIGIGLKAFSSVISLLTTSGVPIPPGLGLIVNFITQGFGDLQTLVTQYEAAPATDKATLVAKIEVVLAGLQANIANFLNGLQIGNPTIDALVVGLLTLIESVLAGFAARLPVSPAARMAARGPLLLRGKPILAATMSEGEFRKRFNAQLAQAGYPQYQIR